MAKDHVVTRGKSAQIKQFRSMSLKLECTEEPLSEAQKAAMTKTKENFDKVSHILREVVEKHGGQLVCQSGNVAGYQYNLPSSVPQVLKTASNIINVNQNKGQPIKLNMINSTTAGQGNVQLVLDPRMGVILGQVQPPVSQQQTINVSVAKSIASNDTNRIRPKTVQSMSQTITVASNLTTPSVGTVRVKPPAKTMHTISTLQAKPTEKTSIGGLLVGDKSGDQIEESKRNQPDGREIQFNKMNGGRTFPSLVVIARPNLHLKEISPQIAQQERTDLDAKVKTILMYSPTKFAEWLIQQGLVRSEQYCQLHSTNYQKAKLKLAMYNDAGTFQFSGGYVWISSCCPERFVSVFCGSIFQGSPQPPSVLLKLIYHWSCQTNVQNVVSWVKVSNVFVKNFYTSLRSICTSAIWDKNRKMGGKHSRIQVGVISLGTTSQDGNLKQVKVEVLGILDTDTMELRLRACDPVNDGDRSYKRKFNSILYPLKDWVHMESKIYTDFTVDKSTLYEMGYTNVVQTSINEHTARNLNSNYTVMEYLRKIVPRMFQNTLSLLSRPMIQQFLDELVWREKFGITSGRAFDTIIQHIAEQTKLDTPDCLIDRLAKVASNPFADWSYTGSQSKTAKSTQQQTATYESSLDKSILKRNKRRAGEPSPEPEPIKKIHLDTRKDISLQQMYYATMEASKNLLAKEKKTAITFKCFLCDALLKSNTALMEHMIRHVPPKIPGRSDSIVCRYCCTGFPSEHQMNSHISETHSNFGETDSNMISCGICEHKFGTNVLLIDHMSSTHNHSEMPYRCESCNYWTSSHKDAIDHFYKVHERGEGLQCPYCLKVILLSRESDSIAPSVHTYLLHLQRHVVRREEGRGKKCPRCCLWFNQKSFLRHHLRNHHAPVYSGKVTPYTLAKNRIMMPKQRPAIRRFDPQIPAPEYPDDSMKKWMRIRVNTTNATANLPCQECEEDIDEMEHYPGEQRCSKCRYVTCCWRAFKEHQRQVHNERPMTSLVVTPPLINIPLSLKMKCLCGFATNDGNLLAHHLVKCKKRSAYPVEDTEPSGIMDSLGLVPKNSSDLC